MPHPQFKVCCSCPEPDDFDPLVDDLLPKFTHKCACPSVFLDYVSAEKNAALCGFREFADPPDLVRSIPEKRYKTLTTTITKEGTNYVNCSDGRQPLNVWTTNVPYQSVSAFNDDCQFETTIQEPDHTRTRTPCLGDPEGPDQVALERCGFSPYPLNEVTETITLTEKIFRDVIDSPDFECEYLKTETLSDEDTEAEALERATVDAGTAETSRYELRTTGAQFLHRTVAYTATAQNLIGGARYKGCIRIQRREAYSGTVPEDADLTWQDVEPDQIAEFIATATEEIVAEDVDLPIAQGWEYRIHSAHLWLAGTGCECPTGYAAP